MKTSVKVAAFFFAVASIIACASGETEILKQARTIQDGIMTSKHNLDSTIDVTIAGWNTRLSAMSADSVAMKDSSNMEEFTSLNERVNELNILKSQLADWTSSLKMLPSTQEIKDGAENPFGKDAKDQEILSSIKKTQDEYNELKSQIETAIQ
jgi:hypothetical protein